MPGASAKGVCIGPGCDGGDANDNSNLMHCIHSVCMLQYFVAAQRENPVPGPKEFLRYATSERAGLPGRKDIGRLRPGMAADLFAIDTRRMDYVGTRYDPESLPGRFGIGMPTDLTMVNGRIVWKDGEFPGLDEAGMAAEAEAVMKATLE